MLTAIANLSMSNYDNLNPYRNDTRQPIAMFVMSDNVGDPYTFPKFGTNLYTDGLCANGWHITIWYLFIYFWKHLCTSNPLLVFACDGSNDAKARKGVPLECLWYCSPLMGHTLQKSLFWGREYRHFKPKLSVKVWPVNDP